MQSPGPVARGFCFVGIASRFDLGPSKGGTYGA